MDSEGKGRMKWRFTTTGSRKAVAEQGECGTPFSGIPPR